MNTLPPIQTPIQPPVGKPSSPVNRTSDYRATDEVRLRANVSAGNETPQQRRAIDKLDLVMSKDSPPSKEVPRGYYLDILV